MNSVAVHGTAVDMKHWVWVTVLLQVARTPCDAVSENKKPKEHSQLSMLLHALGPQTLLLSRWLSVASCTLMIGRICRLGL